jgi:hypothetical protein
MDDHVEKESKLPNLKICIDNTESDEEIRGSTPINDEEELDYNEDIDSNESSDDEKVEINVCVGNLKKSAEGGSKVKVQEDSRVIKSKSDSEEEGEISDSSDETPVEFNVRLGKPQGQSKPFRLVCDRCYCCVSPPPLYLYIYCHQ